MEDRFKTLRVRLNEKEQKRLLEEMEKAGFQNMSEYVRYMTFGEGRSIQGDLKKILEKLNNN